MAMISAGHGKWFARFRQDEVGEFAYEPVIAWDDEGHALIIGHEEGSLYRANIVQTFAGIADAEEVELADMTPEETRERNKRARARR
ncbi:hypothetical protein ACIGW1_18495 [Streptomyces sp. NPDC053780]|uniref:hypothetical protein n=1 Tax=unclassified Streptomyces TaxID=2593676 RepID=UPI003413DB68